MNPLHALCGLAKGDEAQAAAFARWLREHPEGRTVPREIREDVLQDVLANYVARAPEIVESLAARSPVVARLRDGRLEPRDAAALASAERRLHGYVAKSITNRFRSMWRSRRREKLEPEVDVPSEVEPDDGVLEQALTVLDRLERHLLAGVPDPEQARSTLDELRDLALGRRDMDEIVSLEIERSGAEPDARRRVRERLYVRHRRMRQGLCTAIGEMASGGDLDEEEAALALRLVENLLTRRRT